MLPNRKRQLSRTAEAFAFCDSLLSLSHCERLTPDERHWEIFLRLVRETRIRGPRVTHAWFAAMAIEGGCTWITHDRDYARFPDLDWREPV